LLSEPPVGFHVIMRLWDSRAIASTQRAWRSIAVSFLTVGGPYPLLAFRAVDSHIHALVTCARDDAGEFARRVEISMQRRITPGVAFSEVHCVPVVDQRNLSSVFWYVLDNARRHRCEVDPLFEASNLQDLLGMRILGEWTRPLVRGALPRVRGERLRQLLPVAATGDFRDPRLLLEVATGAAGFPDLVLKGRAPSKAQSGWGPLAVQAAAHAAPEISSGEVARVLRASARTICKARSGDPGPELVAAIRQQLALRTAWATADAAGVAERG